MTFCNYESYIVTLAVTFCDFQSHEDSDLVLGISTGYSELVPAASIFSLTKYKTTYIVRIGVT